MIESIVVAVVLLSILAASIRILREYERGVVFFLGRFQKVKGPGLIIILPVLQQMVKTDLRVVTMDVPEQDLITLDNVSVRRKRSGLLSSYGSPGSSQQR